MLHKAHDCSFKNKINKKRCPRIFCWFFFFYFILKQNLEMNPITGLLGKITGVPEPTLRLLVTLLLSYPTAAYYNHKFMNPKVNSSVEERNQFILIAGLCLNLFFNGISIYHSLVTVGVTYGICLIVGENMGDRKLAAGGVWIFNALYLLLGYYFMQTDDYDITWTMTQCILCLRMMGFGFDYYDGRTKQAAKKAPTPHPAGEIKPANPLPLSFQADTPITQFPSPQEILAYSVFPSAFLVGPQFSFSLYKKWLNDTGATLTAEQREERDRAQTLYVWRSAVLAVIYLGLQQTIGVTYSTSYLLTEEYKSFCFLKRALIFTIAGKFAYNKYIGIWLLTEGKNKIRWEFKTVSQNKSFWGRGGKQQKITSFSNHYFIIFRCNCKVWYFL
jgi:lysophospholipid acyltransferase 5